MTQPAHQPADYQYRITKFDPANRDPAGHYLAEDWHLYSQIGEAFGGVVLTAEEYLRVESAYIATAQRFHLESGLPAIRAVSVEGHGDRGAPCEAEVILSERLPAICRAMLREEYWCRIEGDGFFIHFGWDFYMYVGAPNPCEAALEYARSLNLFPEVFTSPYHSEQESS